MSFLYYIPNAVEPGHRGDDTTDGWATLDYSTELARLGEDHGWEGALIGTGWGRPDSLTVASALAARTSSFKPLVAIRPGYWQPAHFANSAATLDSLTGGRLLINIVTGRDELGAYGDELDDPARRYDRTAEFIRLVRRLWSEERVDFEGEYYRAKAASLNVQTAQPQTGHLPLIYFGGASPAAERVAAQEADVQLFWGEPLEGVADRIDRLRRLADELGRDHDAPLEFGLRVTTLIRDTTEQAWHDAEARVAKMAAAATEAGAGRAQYESIQFKAVGQQRLIDLAARGEVLDSCLYTAPGKYGGGGAGTTWLVGSAEDVATALNSYRELGVTHFVLSDTPYREEIPRLGDQLLPLLKS